MYSHNLDVSEKYCKYLYKVYYNGQVYYFFQGIDLTDKNAPNLFTLTDKNRIPFYSSVNKLLIRLLPDDKLKKFDESNFKGWLNNIQLPIKPYYTYDFDVLKEKMPLKSKKQITELMNVINLLDDYAYQIDNKSFIKDVTASPIIMLRDYEVSYSVFKGKSQFEHTDVKDISVEKLQVAINKLNKRIASCFEFMG